MAKKENVFERYRRFSQETGDYVTGKSDVNPLDKGPRMAPTPSLSPRAKAEVRKKVQEGKLPPSKLKLLRKQEN